MYSFTSRGSDQNGSWGGNGYYFCTHSGIRVWWLKDYDDRESAGQVDTFELLFYEGEQVSRDKYDGRWYYVGY